MRNDIDRAHAEFLAQHGGVRPNTPGSEHDGIPLPRIKEWRDRWDELRIL